MHVFCFILALGGLVAGAAGVAGPAGAAGPGDSLRVRELPQREVAVAPGQYSGIAYLEGNRYAVVDDKLPGGGIVLFEIPLRDDGTVRARRVRRRVPEATRKATVTGRDNEGVAFAGGMLYVSAEGDQSIREYDREGRETGRTFAVPDELGSSAIFGNAGFEALTYHPASERFWTTTELPLKADGRASRQHRLQRFDAGFQPDGQWLYRMDAPRASESEAAAARAYVFGISALAALDDGRLIVLEREVYVPLGTKKESMANTFADVKLYVVDPTAASSFDNAADTTRILPKVLLASFTTGVSTNAAGIDLSLANYEGMCLGPRLPDGSRCLILIADSQAGMPELSKRLGRKRLSREYIKVLLLSPAASSSD